MVEMKNPYGQIFNIESKYAHYYISLGWVIV
jgi:hypothetical protein